jgi:Arc/MetJ-type ribon-helix-helix transcriptional regulator
MPSKADVSGSTSYAIGVKTTVSIPDDLYAGAEQLRRRLRKSRSQLYADALREYLARHDLDAITEALNRVYEQLDSRSDPAVAAAAWRLLERAEW